MVDTSDISYEAPDFQSPDAPTQLFEIIGQFPRVTSIPTWVPKTFQQSFAVDTTNHLLYFYDFANNAWRQAGGSTTPTALTYTPAGGATATLTLASGNLHFITMPAGNITIALSGDTNNQVFYIKITQDATGSRTVTWFTTIKWTNGVAPTLSTGANKRDAFAFVRTGSGTYDGFIVGQNF